MTAIQWTAAQKAAIETVGASALVSAGAGSGKTAVLAERCARLVADLDPPCAVDRLLVVTFTDAAAAEMRRRIARAIAQRLERSPGNLWLRRQVELVDDAAICTLHSFCLRILGRYFAHADLDPQMPLIDPHDAVLLRTEAVRKVFDAYEAREDAEGEAFLQLLTAYTVGSERALMNSVRGLDDFLTSIVEPDAWIDQVQQRYEAAGDELPELWREAWAASLISELAAQIRAVTGHAETIGADDPLCRPSFRCLEEYIARLTDWRSRLERSQVAATLDEVCKGGIGEWKFPAPPKWTKAIAQLPEAEQVAFRRAADLVREVRDDLFKKRLKRDFGRFSAADWAEGMARVRPHLRIFLRLVQDARSAYQTAKRDLGVMDFSDLERKTVELLRNDAVGVAARLRDRFEHVLVDEFQDINPLQAEILRLVSREEDHGRAANLFAVGDVKQSIYRFRLAEPRLFLDRKARFGGDALHAAHGGSAEGESPDRRGRLLTLSDNFRGRPRLLEAINAVMERVMARDLGDIDYDDEARLRPGRSDNDFPSRTGPAGKSATGTAESGAAVAGAAVELHILDPLRGQGVDPPRREADGASVVTDEGARAESDSSDASDSSAENDPSDAPESSDDSPEDWLRIEREACLIARRIESCVRAGYAWRDIVILMRSMQARSVVLMRTLARAGIPAHADVAGGFFDAQEVRDVLALLSLLDNPRQDIPLAALLRSPLLRAPLTDDDLAHLRGAAGPKSAAIPFCVAVEQYARHGPDPLRARRLADVLDRLAEWRRQARRRPLADVLWRIYDETGYLAFASGLRDGSQRRANLVRLHEYARQFGTFRRQGLARFLAFMDALKESGADLEAGRVSRGADDAVRVMTIHGSKGLEFPVVIVAELGKDFNLTDARRSILFDRRLGVGMEAVDEERRIIYPTLPHRLVAQAVTRESLAEEMRLLYVAMTRARERLILVGTKSLKRVEERRQRYSEQAGPLPPADRRSARSMMDWVAASVCCMDESRARFALGAADAVAPTDGLIDVRLYGPEEMKDWSLDPPIAAARQDILERLARFEPVPNETPETTDGECVRLVARRLLTPYPAAALTRVPAVAAASVLKRRWETRWDAEEPGRMMTDAGESRSPAIVLNAPTIVAEASETHATRLGTWTHELLQRIDLSRPCDIEDLRIQRADLVAAGALREQESMQIDLESVAWFLQTEIGRRMRAARTRLMREWPFVMGVDPARYDPSATTQDARDRMLVRGIIDCLFDAGDGWEVLDYKTDRFEGGLLDERAALYRGQLEIYAAAAGMNFGAPVRRLHLAFLFPRRIVSWSPAGD